MKYAKQTKVPVERSKLELDRLLKRYGAESSAVFTSQERAVVIFEYRRYRIKFVLRYPSLEAFQPSRRGRTVSPATRREQAIRSLWRSLVLVIHAKFEAIEHGIVSVEEEFLSYIIAWPDGSSIGEKVIPQLQAMPESPPLLEFFSPTTSSS